MQELELLFVIIIIQSLVTSFMLHFLKWIEIFFIRKHNDKIQQVQFSFLNNGLLHRVNC